MQKNPYPWKVCIVSQKCYIKDCYDQVLEQKALRNYQKQKCIEQKGHAWSRILVASIVLICKNVSRLGCDCKGRTDTRTYLVWDLIRIPNEMRSGIGTTYPVWELRQCTQSRLRCSEQKASSCLNYDWGAGGRRHFSGFVSFCALQN